MNPANRKPELAANEIAAAANVRPPMDTPASINEAISSVVCCSGTPAETIERMDLITADNHGE